MHSRRLVLAVVVIAAAQGCKKDAPAAAAPAPAAAAPSELTFSLVPPKVGERFANGSSFKMDLEITAQADKDKVSSTMGSTETSAYTVEYLAVEGEGVTKGKITYQDKKTVDVEDGKAKDAEPSPVVGKTYLASLDGDAVVVTTEAGKKVSADEESEVKDDADFLGKTDPFRTAFPKRPLKVGEAVPELNDAIQTLVVDAAPSDEEPVIKDVKVTLSEDKGEVGVFAIAMTMVTKDDDMDMSVALKGTLEVRKSDTQLLTMKLDGPITMKKTDDPSVKLEGKGTMSVLMTQKPL